MAKLILQNQTEPASPDVGCTTLYVDCTDKQLKMKDSDGCIYEMQSTSFTDSINSYLYGTGCDGCCHITQADACDIDTNHNVFLCAKEWNFTDFIIDEGVIVRFCGDGIPIIKVNNCFCNQGIINTRTGPLSYSECGLMFLGRVIQLNNLASIGTLYTCSGGAGASSSGWYGVYGGNGGGYGQAGSASGSCSYYCPHQGGAACCCNGGGGGGQNYFCYTGYDGCPATEFNGGKGGDGNGAAGGGGGRGICCGGDGGAGDMGGSGGNGYYGKGGDGGSGGQKNQGENQGRGGNSMFGNGGKGGDGRFSGNGGDSYYGNGGNGGTGCNGGHGGNSYAGNGGNGGYSYCNSGTRNSGGNSVGGAYGLAVFAKNIYNNCIYAAGGCGGAAGSGGNGSSVAGCGTSGGNIAIMYNDGILGCINISKGTGANSANLKDGDLNIQKNIFI